MGCRHRKCVTCIVSSNCQIASLSLAALNNRFGTLCPLCPSPLYTSDSGVISRIFAQIYLTGEGHKGLSRYYVILLTHPPRRSPCTDGTRRGGSKVLRNFWTTPNLTNSLLSRISDENCMLFGNVHPCTLLGANRRSAFLKRFPAR